MKKSRAKWSKKKKILVIGIIVAVVAVAIIGGAVYQQIMAKRAKEAEKPYITLEANAVIDEKSNLTGIVEFSIYNQQPEDKEFASMSLVVEYGKDVVPCDASGNPLTIEGTTKLPIPTITTEGFTSTATIEANANGGGLLYLSIASDEAARHTSSTFPLTTVKFAYDPQLIQPWVDDEKDGPHWVNNTTTGLFWFATSERAATAPWSCRLFYASEDNLYYSSDAVYENMKDYTSVAPEKDFDSNKLSFNDARTATQWSDPSKIRTRLVNEPTIARETSEDEGQVGILFFDQHDELVGSLVVPANKDARAAVNEYVKTTLVHPDLQNADVSSLTREASYRGVIDGSAEDGVNYPLTNTFDYTFMKRPMSIVNNGVWEQKVGFDGKPEWDEEYPYTHGWSVVTYKDLPQATPSVMGIGELAGYTGADPDTGAYVNCSVPRLTVSPVGYSHYTVSSSTGGLVYSEMIREEPLTTDFSFANFDFSRVKPVLPSDIGKVGKLMMVKACIEPGDKLQAGTYEMEDVPSYTRQATYLANFTLTRILKDADGKGVHGIPLLREPMLSALYINPYRTMKGFWPDYQNNPDLVYEVRYTQENGYEILVDGTWEPMPERDWGYPTELTFDETRTVKNPCIYPAIDETEGSATFAQYGLRGWDDIKASRGNDEINENIGSISETQTGYYVLMWWPITFDSTEQNNKAAALAKNLKDEITDYHLVETYGGDVWYAQFGVSKSLGNYDYIDTCRWTEDYNGTRKSGSHETECKLLHPFSPYLVPYYVSPYEKGPNQHLWNNLGDKQIIPAQWMLQNPNYPVPEKNMDPKFDDTLNQFGRVYSIASGFIDRKVEIQVATEDTFDLQYNAQWYSALNPAFVEWTSADENIATVTYDATVGTAVVTGVNAGETTISATQGKKSLSIKVIVSPQIDELQCDDIILLRNSVIEIPISKAPADTTNTVPITYTSSDQSIVKVTYDGKLQAGKPGYATLTAKCGNLIVKDIPVIVCERFTVTDKNREKIGFTGKANENLNIIKTFVEPEDGLTYMTTAIGDYAFYGEDGLVKVSMPDSVENIGRSAFFDCTNLTDISLGNLVQIGDCAFQGCTSLATLYVPDSVRWIGDMAFEELPDVVYNGPAQGIPWGADNVRKQ